METLYRKVAVSEPAQFEHNKYYYFVDFDGNILRDCFFNYASFDEYTQRYKHFLVEIPDPTAQLQADKAELLEALEASNCVLANCSFEVKGETSYQVGVRLSNNESLIQKMKQ